MDPEVEAAFDSEGNLIHGINFFEDVGDGWWKWVCCCGAWDGHYSSLLDCVETYALHRMDPDLPYFFDKPEGGRMFVCDACKTSYLRKGRLPKSGQHQYCPACRASGRGASKVWREHKKET